MESIEIKEAEQFGHDLASLSLDSAYPHPDNFATLNDEEYNYEWLFGTGLFNNVVVVDNLPVVGANGVEKLESLVQMNCGQYGVIKEGGVSRTLDPRTQKSLGYCFTEYSTRKEAENAQKNINGQKMDEGHTLLAYLYNEFDGNMDTSDGGLLRRLHPTLTRNIFRKLLSCTVAIPISKQEVTSFLPTICSTTSP